MQRQRCFGASRMPTTVSFNSLSSCVKLLAIVAAADVVAKQFAVDRKKTAISAADG